ncbi:putative membrane protein YqiK [Methylobacterium radiotolerans]
MLERVLVAAPALAEIGVAAVSVRLTNLAPTSELERALQTPTFEALQQKADEATFARRALAVEKERAIAENELATKTELARRETVLIAQEAENARDRAAGVAEARGLEAAAEAERIRLVEGARAEAEQRRAAVYRDMPPAVLLGLAARELAGKLETIEHVNVTPDLLAAVLGEFRGALPARLAPR